MESQGRGMVTDRIKEKSIELLGYEITTKELRLMAYTVYVMMNAQKTDRAVLSNQDKEIYDAWQVKGYCERNANFFLAVTHEFWTAMCELVWLGYVDLS